MKKLNKRKMIKEYVERFDDYLTDNIDEISEKDYKKLMREARKIITNFIKTYPYENDGYEEYVDDYDYFEADLIGQLKRHTTFLREYWGID